MQVRGEAKRRELSAVWRLADPSVLAAPDDRALLAEPRVAAARALPDLPDGFGCWRLAIVLRGVRYLAHPRRRRTRKTITTMMITITTRDPPVRRLSFPGFPSSSQAARINDRPTKHAESRARVAPAFLSFDTGLLPYAVTAARSSCPSRTESKHPRSACYSQLGGIGWNRRRGRG